MKKLLLAAAMALAPAAATAQAGTAAPANPAPAAQAPLADADPALWVVRDDDTTIYLFGTFHLLDGRPWFNDEVRTAFDASNELVLEARMPENLADMQPLIVRYALDPNGRRLSQRLTPERNALFRAALTEAGAPAEAAAAFDMFEPWFASMTLVGVASQRLGIRPEHGAEMLLSQAARERGIEIGELEGVEWQFQMFDTMPEAQQLAQLSQTIDSIDSMDEALAPMLAAWSAGNVDELQRLINSQSEEDPALHQMMFTNRNRTWAGKIRDRMARAGTVFIAVGAGHLAGGDSVQAMLAQYGLRAERVPHVEGATAAAN